jgi:hypothetical protein
VVEASVLEVAVVPDVFVVPTVPDVTVDAVVGSVAASPQEQTSKQTAIIRHISFSTFLFIKKPPDNFIVFYRYILSFYTSKSNRAAEHWFFSLFPTISQGFLC